MLLSFLQNEYKINAPIFVSDVAEQLGMTAASARQGFKRLVDRGVLCRYAAGIYYFAQPSRLFRASSLDMENVIISKYIRRNGKTIGYYSELALANIAGITTQMPAEKCIVTNLEKSRGRNVIIKNRRFRVKAPRVLVNENNLNALIILDLISDAMKYSEYDWSQTAALLRAYVGKLGVSKADVLVLLPYYPGKTSKLLLEMGIYDVLKGGQ